MNEQQPGMGSFQDRFAQALFTQADTEATSRLLAQPAFAVYRNTVMKGCIDALEANYPSVVRLVGREWFRSAAAEFARRHPPQGSALVHYGEALPAFLQGLEATAELPYLPHVARLDRFWSESHTAGDAQPLLAAALAQLSPDALVACRLRPHPATRWAWFDEQPIYSIWARNRSDDPALDEVLWQSEGALLTRPGTTVQWQAAERADCAFLDACADGKALGEATEQAHQASPQADLMAMLARLLSAGALAPIESPTNPGEPS